MKKLIALMGTLRAIQTPTIEVTSTSRAGGRGNTASQSKLHQDIRITTIELVGRRPE